MRIFFIPYGIEGESKKNALLYRHQEGNDPCLFMRNVHVDTSENDCLQVFGEFAEGQAIDALKDGDRLFVPCAAYTPFDPFYLDMEIVDGMLLPFKSEPEVLAVAAGMESGPLVYVAEHEKDNLLSNAKLVMEKAGRLYKENAMYKNIMLKEKGGVKSVSILELAAMQKKEKHRVLISLFSSISTMFNDHTATAKRILKQCEFEEEFSLLTSEEQVSAFIDFSKMTARQKTEYVTDEMIADIEGSPEYARVKEDLEKNGLGISKTQQFNVFQQVGFFSSRHGEDILYNLSDMGAGKTLMTVEAIYLMDLKRLSQWAGQRGTLPEQKKVQQVFLPDKNIIAPTLSVKSSWIDTFRLFYGVEQVSDTEYTLTASFGGIMATSKVYVSPFTVRNGKIFTSERLPTLFGRSYLIVDEIHQLVKRNISKTKFFQPKTKPVEVYDIFILSGTMSNMTTAQWFNFMRFMSLPITKNSASAANGVAEQNRSNMFRKIREATDNVQTQQHRYFDTEPVSVENYYWPETKKMTSIEQEFFTAYGTYIIAPFGENEQDVEGMLSTGRFSLRQNLDEADNINFELFYKIVGAKAITAQSLQVAEELFGEQKKQHASDIIKTVSPLSKSDIHILKVLHHIAEDHMKYKSTVISKAINNAILNLNDGLQTKNIYEIVSGFAERNLRFLEYLSTLDVDILEQLPKSGLIAMPKLEDTDKFKVLKDILRREKDETHLIVVNDYYALKQLSLALGIGYLTKEQLRQELDYQEVLDDLFAKQSIVIVTQDMIKSSLDLVQANRLIQYQLNTEISDIIQTQNRINRIGQTRETRGYYIASDQLQENLIELFLESYRNIRVAHKGIVELFTDITSQINIINDYLERAFSAIEQDGQGEPEGVEPEEAPMDLGDLAFLNAIPDGESIVDEGGISQAILFPQGGQVLVLVRLSSGSAFPIGQLSGDVAVAMRINAPTPVMWDLGTNRLVA